MKVGGRHSDETRARITESQRARSKEISEQTKARMADPAVRQRIKDGMRAAAAASDELRSMRAAWRCAKPQARRRFLDELLTSIFDDGGDT